MKTTFAAAIAILGLAALPAVASAETAYVNSSVNLRTGPASDYPRITTLGAGQRVEIYGCIDDWSWCDVSTSRDRGWVSAGYLNYDYSGRRVAISSSGAKLGLPLLSFVLGTYWDEHYRSKSWYSQRSQWQQRHPQHAGPSQQKQAQPRATRPNKQTSAAPQQTGRQSQGQQPAQPQQQQGGQKKPAAQQDGKKSEKGPDDQHRPH